MPVLTEVAGTVKYEDLKENVTMHEELNPVTKIIERVVVEHKADYHPQIIILDDSERSFGNLSDSYRRAYYG